MKVTLMIEVEQDRVQDVLNLVCGTEITAVFNTEEPVCSSREGTTGCGTEATTGCVNDQPTLPALNTQGLEVDADGTPWDERIHSSGKTKYSNTNGDKKKDTWIRKKKVADEVYNAVMNELKARIGLSKTEIPAPPVTDTPKEPEIPAPPETDMTFIDLVTYVTSNRISMEAVNTLCQKYNLAAFDSLAIPDNAGLIPVIAAALKGMEA